MHTDTETHTNQTFMWSQSSVQTRCCSPLLVCLLAGRPFHCENMDSLSHLCNHLLHLTAGHLGTHSLTYSLCWSVTGWKEGVSIISHIHVDVHVYLCVCWNQLKLWYSHKPCPPSCSSSDTQSQWRRVEQWSSRSMSWEKRMMWRLENRKFQIWTWSHQTEISDWKLNDLEDG